MWSHMSETEREREIEDEAEPLQFELSWTLRSLSLSFCEESARENVAKE